MRRRTAPFLLLPVLTLGLGACVTKGTHQTALDSLARAQAAHEETREAMQAQEEEYEALLAEERTARQAEERRLTRRIAELEAELEDTSQRLARAETRFEEAREEVHRLEVLLRERGSEFQELERRLQALRAIEQEVRQRNAIYEEVIGRFQSLIDAGRLSVAIDRGRMVIQLPQDILFGSGSATLGADGRSTLAEVGEALAGIEDRTFQVEGHTDNVPISTERFPSNWELSTARALSVVRILVQQGVPADRLSGAGYAEYQPRASNDTAEGRRQNRRIEIVMLPNLNVIAASEVPSG